MSYPASIVLKRVRHRVATFTGIGGSFAVEWVAAFAWIRWQRWAGIRNRLSAAQTQEVNRLIKQSATLKEVNEEILQIANSIKHETIDQILAMDEMELAIAVLSGKIKPTML